jgi:hypothetical protein
VPFCQYPQSVFPCPLTGFDKNLWRWVADDDFKRFDVQGCPPVRPPQMKMRNTVFPTNYLNFPVAVMMETGHFEKIENIILYVNSESNEKRERKGRVSTLDTSSTFQSADITALTTIFSSNSSVIVLMQKAVSRMVCMKSCRIIF